MQEEIAKLIGNALIEAGERIKSLNCELSEDEAMNILEIIAHRPMSREEACDYLNVNNSKFYELITLKKIPAGRKRRGFKELCWYKDELDAAIAKMRNKK